MAPAGPPSPPSLATPCIPHHHVLLSLAKSTLVKPIGKHAQHMVIFQELKGSFPVELNWRGTNPFI
jgi:hypothetical protein